MSWGASQKSVDLGAMMSYIMSHKDVAVFFPDILKLKLFVSQVSALSLFALYLKALKGRVNIYCKKCHPHLCGIALLYHTML